MCASHCPIIADQCILFIHNIALFCVHSTQLQSKQQYSECNVILNAGPRRVCGVRHRMGIMPSRRQFQSSFLPLSLSILSSFHLPSNGRRLVSNTDRVCMRARADINTRHCCRAKRRPAESHIRPAFNECAESK